MASHFPLLGTLRRSVKHLSPPNVWPPAPEDMVAAVTNGPAAGIASTSDCADMPDPLEEEKHLPMD